MKCLSKLDQFVLRTIVASTAWLRQTPSFVAYLVVTISVFLIELIRIWFLGGIPATLPNNIYLPFYVVVILAALCFYRYSGIYGTFLIAIVSAATKGPIPHSIAIRIEPIPTVAFLIMGTVISTLIESLHHLYDRHRDISERNEIFIQDLNHRVKNHLAVLSGVVSLSRRKVRDSECAEILAGVGGRIGVLSRLYDRLHLDRDNAAVRIGLANFLAAICEDISAGVVGDRDISIDYEIVPMSITAAKAVPMGLLVNELVTNSLKHAFPDERNGTVNIGFTSTDGRYVLTVHDNGVGGQIDKSGTGMRLIQNLTTQLDGKMEVKIGPGRETRIVFPKTLRD